MLFVSMEHEVDVTALELWYDDGNGLFSETTDPPLGALRWTGARWERTGLAVPIPVGGRRLFVTAAAGGTITELNIAGRPKLVDQLARVLRLGVTSWVR